MALFGRCLSIRYSVSRERVSVSCSKVFEMKRGCGSRQDSIVLAN